MNDRPKILIVDDEAFNVDYLEQELEDLDYETISASNGLEALDRVQSDAPDLILLDIMMPTLDGFEVLTRLKMSPATRDIPVIIISALNDLQSVVRGVQRGAEDYLPKPFEPTLLKARISASLEKKSLRDQQRKLLHTFATPQVAEELLASGFTLGGKNITASIMFVDIRSFTSISEKHSAAETIELLNDYFAAIFEPVARHGGIVNNIMGDGMLAVFGATSKGDNYREQAARAAIEILEVVKTFNEKQAAAGKVQIQIGIGIASGDLLAGYAGTQHRATYTCIGDTVNMASRLESHTKEVHRPIIIEGVTRAGLPDSIRVEPLGEALLRGKSQPIEVFAVPPQSSA
ncbi:MAG: adenylate/guanylate cyclase domain-containing protein [Chloroflexota bacterium]